MRWIYTQAKHAHTMMEPLDPAKLCSNKHLQPSLFCFQCIFHLFFFIIQISHLIKFHLQLNIPYNVDCLHDGTICYGTAACLFLFDSDTSPKSNHNINLTDEE